MVGQASPSDSQAFFLSRDRFPDFLAALQSDGRTVIGPTARNHTVELAEITEVEQLPAGVGLDNQPGRSRVVRSDSNRYFDYAPGPMSWKRWTFPPRVAQLDWVAAGEGSEPRATGPDAAPTTFLGVRACEIEAIAIQDRVLRDGSVSDPDYAARRAGNVVVAVECAVAGSTCFCTTMGTGPEVGGGFDLALSELAEGFVVRVGSPAGDSTVAGLDLPPATDAQRAGAASSVAAVREAMGAPLDMTDMPARLIAAAESPHWAEIAERCLACTNCTLVCPTCFCTSVGQSSDLDGDHAATDRSWDSCFTHDFARIAGGNFRPQVKDRYRQWLTHKFGTWWDQFGTSGCVGCGRCVTWCPVGIDVREELMRVTEALPVASEALGVSVLAPIALPVAPTTRLPLPVLTAPAKSTDGDWITARVRASRTETTDVVTLDLATDDSELLAGRPGQFVMAALPGLAAPPISISRFSSDGFELTVRAAGPATRAICDLTPGDTLAIRGPLGRGWPVDEVQGRDVLVIAGGIGLAPLRPLLDEVIRRRQRVGRVQLAFGARTPADRLFVAELDDLAARDVIEVAMTVDRAGPEWLGRVGVVTQVIDRQLCSCDRTVAFVCGPERMMQATASTLLERGVPAERIYVTLERHMECGVGLCGHCQLGPFFVCRDGPVFSLAELGPAFRIEGL